MIEHKHNNKLKINNITRCISINQSSITSSPLFMITGASFSCWPFRLVPEKFAPISPHSSTICCVFTFIFIANYLKFSQNFIEHLLKFLSPFSLSWLIYTKSLSRAFSSSIFYLGSITLNASALSWIIYLVTPLAMSLESSHFPTSNAL